MKILQIAPPWIPTPPNGYGGTEVVIDNLCKGFVELGHEVTLFATKNSKSPDELDYVFEKSLLEMDIDWTAALPPILHYHQAFKRAHEFDIIHAHLSSGTDMALLPFLSDIVKEGVPAVITIHGHLPYDRFSHMDSYYFDYYGQEISMINISLAMEKRLPDTIRKAGVVHNSLDVTTMKFGGEHKGYLTWLGKIVPDKGIHEAIMIAKKANEKFIFAGVVDEKDFQSRTYFETKVKPFVDGKQIVYIGPADLKTKTELLSEAKAFLNPINWDEPFGMVIVEALACGTPVISYQRGAIPEIVKNGKTGFLVKNEKEMVKAIGKVDQIKRGDCRAHIEQNFSPIAAAKKHVKIYEAQITNTNAVRMRRVHQFKQSLTVIGE